MSSSEYNKLVGEFIRKERTKRNLTMKELASKVGMTYYKIREIEWGRNGLSYEDAVTICKAFGIGLDEISNYVHEHKKRPS